MNIHEYQAKQVLKKFGVRISDGRLVEEGGSVEDHAEKAAKELQQAGASLFVVKAQIHAGGRGKAGGVKVCKDLPSVRAAAKEIMGKTLVTPQTGPQGKVVHKIWIEAGSDIEKEFYFGIVTDRSVESVVMMASTEGGVEIEEVAEKHPEKIIKVVVDPTTGYMPFHGRSIAKALGLTADQTKDAVKTIGNLYRAYMEMDCAQLEINPLILTKKGELLEE